MRVETKQVLIYSATFFSATIIVGVVGFSLLADVEQKVRDRTRELNENLDAAIREMRAVRKTSKN